MTSTKGATNIKNRRSRLLAVLCAVCLTVSVTVPAFAAEISSDPQEYTATTVSRGPIVFPVSFDSGDIALYNQFAAMTDSELTAYVNNLSPASQGISGYSTGEDDEDFSVLAIRGLIAVAALFVKLGLPCAAELVLHALEDEDYYETNGLFTEKIKQSPLFLNWVTTAVTDILYFPPDDPNENIDLYYSFRHATFSSPYSTVDGKVIYCYDTFDFRGQEVAETLKATVLNEGAWLLTQLGVMFPIDIQISFIY